MKVDRIVLTLWAVNVVIYNLIDKFTSERFEFECRFSILNWVRIAGDLIKVNLTASSKVFYKWKDRHQHNGTYVDANRYNNEERHRSVNTKTEEMKSKCSLHVNAISNKNFVVWTSRKREKNDIEFLFFFVLGLLNSLCSAILQLLLLKSQLYLFDMFSWLLRSTTLSTHSF